MRLLPDEWLFNYGFQPVADFVDLRWEINHWQIGRFFMPPFLLSNIALVMRIGMERGFLSAGFIVVAALLVLTFASMPFWWALVDAREQGERRGFANPARHCPADTFFRVFMALQCVINGVTGNWLTLCSTATYTLCFYFLACETVPPHKRRAFEEREAMRFGHSMEAT